MFYYQKQAKSSTFCDFDTFVHQKKTQNKKVIFHIINKKMDFLMIL